jgi:hypothetical protein
MRKIFADSFLHVIVRKIFFNLFFKKYGSKNFLLANFFRGKIGPNLKILREASGGSVTPLYTLPRSQVRKMFLAENCQYTNLRHLSDVPVSLNV